MFLAEENFRARAQSLGKVCMNVHDEFAAYAMRTAEEAHCQIDRLAAWRA
jgi:hypothetical protein